MSEHTDGAESLAEYGSEAQSTDGAESLSEDSLHLKDVEDEARSEKNNAKKSYYYLLELLKPDTCVATGRST
jgi:hypothetical protein